MERAFPTCKSAGLDIEYLMLRGIFMTPGATADQVAYYVDLLKKVRETPEWKTLMNDGAFNQTFMTGADYAKWVENEEKRHRDLMKEAGFLADQQLSRPHVVPAGLAMTGGTRAYLPEEAMSDTVVGACERKPGRRHRLGRSRRCRCSRWLFGAIVIVGSLQVGINWGVEGPKAGFFPFYIGRDDRRGERRPTWSRSSPTSIRDKLFASWGQLRQVLSVVIPTTVYVAGWCRCSGSTSRRCCCSPSS